MEVAFTTEAAHLGSQDLLCVVEMGNVPRKDEEVEIDDIIYIVGHVEWHISTDEGKSEDHTIGDLMDVIVRLVKVGEA